MTKNDVLLTTKYKGKLFAVYIDQSKKFYVGGLMNTFCNDENEEANETLKVMDGIFRDPAQNSKLCLRETYSLIKLMVTQSEKTITLYLDPPNILDDR
uniref:Uncharacterized protein n=1 Tax=Romanomermis culicivorax TaxID=13658 RepID=A0A915JV68_ROMCU